MTCINCVNGSNPVSETRVLDVDVPVFTGLVALKATAATTAAIKDDDGERRL